MSLIGMLEQIDVKSVLRRIEQYSKTGLFVVKQGSQWLEMYFRDGRLMWVGPAHAQVDLGTWLLQSGIISAQIWQSVVRSLGSVQLGEMRVALAMMDLGYVEHDQLRSWAVARAHKAVEILFSWRTGEMYFEDDMAPPAEHLLVALSIVSLFPTHTEASTIVTTNAAPAPVATLASSAISRPLPAVVQEQPKAGVSSAHVSNAPTLMESSQFFSSPLQAGAPVTSLSDDVMIKFGIGRREGETATAGTALTSPPRSTPSTPSALRLISDAPEGQPTQLMPSASVSASSTPLVAPKRIDTSFMQPDMVLVPANLSALREQNAQVQLTPDQWRVLTLVDGKTTLQGAHQALLMQPHMVCQIVGELMALGLIRVQSSFDFNHQMNVMQQHVREAAKGDAGSNYVSVSSGKATIGFSAPLPTANVAPKAHYTPALPYATQSQWGNGGNGATFVPGRGWVTSQQPLQPLQSSGPIATGRAVAYAGSGQ